MQNIRDVAASFLRKQENQQSKTQTYTHTLVCSCHCGAVIYCKRCSCRIASFPDAFVPASDKGEINFDI